MIISDRTDPYLNFNFEVEIDGIIEAEFSEIKGLQVETELEPVKEGGVNEYIHQLPKGVKYSNLVLKRGITDSTELWDWHQNVLNGIIERRSGAILLKGNVLHDKKLQERKIRWNFIDAYPVKWTGPDLNSKDPGISFETIELVHNGIYLL